MDNQLKIANIIKKRKILFYHVNADANYSQINATSWFGKVLTCISFFNIKFNKISIKNTFKLMAFAKNAWPLDLYAPK